jgi:hypothetical protein
MNGVDKRQETTAQPSELGEAAHHRRSWRRTLTRRMCVSDSTLNLRGSLIDPRTSNHL